MDTFCHLLFNGAKMQKSCWHNEEITGECEAIWPQYAVSAVHPLISAVFGEILQNYKMKNEAGVGYSPPSPFFCSFSVGLLHRAALAFYRLNYDVLICASIVL